MKRPDRRRRVRPRASRQRSLQKRRRPRGEVRLRQRPSSVRRSLIRLTLRRRRSRRSLPSLRSRARRRHRARLVLVAAFSTTRAEIRSTRSSSPFRAPLSRVSRVFARCKRLSRVVPRVRARASARARDAATRVATRSDARRGPCFLPLRHETGRPGRQTTTRARAARDADGAEPVGRGVGLRRRADAAARRARRREGAR